MPRLAAACFKVLVAACVAAAAALVYFDARIAGTFTARTWEAPARVFARPLELFVGRGLRAEDLSYELDLLGYRKVDNPVAPGQVARRGDQFELYSRGFAFPGEQEPAQRLSISLAQGRVVRLQGASRPVDLARLDPVQIGGIYPRHGEDRILEQLGDLPPTFVAGLLAVEDRGFYQHWGFSISGIVRAALRNVDAGQVVAGGSTITQQLVKNYYLTPERTLVRKLTELMMAVLLELRFEKAQILEAYVNEVYLGQEGPRAIHGFPLASLHYFDEPLPRLGLHQQALLIGMVKGPSLYNPLRNPDRARERRDVVLNVMAEQGVISAEQAARARALPLGLSQRERRMNSYPAYLDLVRRQLRRDYRDADLTSLGLSIFTAFDPVLQRQAERSIETVLPRLDRDRALEAAMVVSRPDNGEVVAVVGGRSVRFAGFNRALDSRRPAGSLLKVAVYLAALEQPQRFSLATPLKDGPIRVEGPPGRFWEPRNFDRESHGDVLLHHAMAQSYNQASVHLGMAVGVPAVVDMARRLGLSGRIPALPSVILGAGEYSPLEVLGMYQTIAAGGFQTPLRSIRDIVDANGASLRRYPLEYDRQVGLEAMHLLHYALREVMQEGTGSSAYRILPRDFQVAGKTGTSDEGRDAWFAGFSGDLVAVVWVGRDDNAALRISGATGALPVWTDFIAAASERQLDYRMPDGIEVHWVDDRTGELSAEYCSGARQLPFIAGFEPAARSACLRDPRPPGADTPLHRARNWFQRLLN
jgi:penicillin-binding protein 1B